ncbi:hypothetical protein M404DRAFT_806230 [Pisolithus tinctorius Marx 270]|uniref:Uncharacterized protein n=1 Tax=Pisolithus tinctorius Marx 270 TaxID=870435 RepID=A0A0C3JPZ6_PISTI|nr:hypothetical protein M404DRAFT_806230 [Pisolithus tinctorius Marx 270]
MSTNSLQSLAIMSAVMGTVSYVVGVIPLSIALSNCFLTSGLGLARIIKENTCRSCLAWVRDCS